MNFCEKCRQQNEERHNKCECDYEEIQMFLDYISDDLGKQFELYDCPDKNTDKDSGAKYTCDFVLVEKNTSEKMYVEVKTVLYGFDNPADGREDNESIKQYKDQMLCMQLVSDVVARCDEIKMDSLWDFMVSIPQLKIGTKECEKFCRQLESFLDETSFKEDEYCFIYKWENRGKEEEIKLLFTRKNDALREKFNESIGFQCDISGDGQIDAIFKRMTDVKKLRELLKKNADKTSKKNSDKNKFPETEERKVLLNILELPKGLELFFDINIKAVIGQLMEDSEDYKSTADENYLLYHSPEYYEIDSSRGVKKIGNVLFVIPLIKGLVNDVIVYGGLDN